MWIFVLAMLLVPSAHGQGQPVGLRCTAAAEPNLVRSEGVSESAGTIVLICTPLTTRTGTVTAAISLTATTALTNRIAGDGTVDATLEVDKGGGMEMTASRARPAGANTAVFDSLSFPMPSNGHAAFRISGLRISGGGSESTVGVYISSAGGSGLAVYNNPIRVGVARRSLAAAGVPAAIGSRTAVDLQNPTFSALLSSGIKSTTMRVTETTPGAFEARQAAATNGTRLVVRYSGLPNGAHVWVSNVIAGSSSGSPTSAGDYGLFPSAGIAGPGLTLARVALADENGAGGAVVPWADPSSTEGVFEAIPANGAATVAYEVVNSDPNLLEFAHIAIFVCFPPGAAEGTIATATVSLGPISTQNSASTTAPVPRFAAIPPEKDCSLLGDCDGVYGARLEVSASLLTFQVAPGSSAQEGSIRIANAGDGTLDWTASVEYTRGSRVEGWIKISPSSGVGPGTIKVTAEVAALPVGIHGATLFINAGQAGSESFAVSGEVMPPGSEPQAQGPAIRRPRLTSVTNGADGGIATLVPGSLATVRGSNLEGLVTVSLEGQGALILAASAERIDFVVPDSLSGLDKAQLVVTVGGERIESRPVSLSRMSPAIFDRGVFNQDWSEHGESKPERAGNILQVFATGLPLPMDGVIIAKIHDREISLPAYAGPAPGLAGIQQVNVRIPDDLRPTDTNLWLCGIPARDPVGRVCSLPSRIRIAE